MMLRTLWREPERFVTEYFTKVPGAYFTYDAAIQDSDGHFWVLGRVDDVINVAGHRLSTMEIESVVMECKGVAEARACRIRFSARRSLLPAHRIHAPRIIANRSHRARPISKDRLASVHILYSGPSQHQPK